jgi:hypothetical protein
MLANETESLRVSLLGQARRQTDADEKYIFFAHRRCSSRQGPGV